jgi:hypothetical protein
MGGDGGMDGDRGMDGDGGIDGDGDMCRRANGVGDAEPSALDGVCMSTRTL